MKISLPKIAKLGQFRFPGQILTYALFPPSLSIFIVVDAVAC